MAENSFGKVVDSLLEGLEGFATAKTVVGEPMQVNDTILIPLVDVSIGLGAGAALNDTKSKDHEGGGMGAKLSPNAVLVIKDGNTKVISLKNQTAVTKAMDMVPELINRFTGKNKIDDPEVEEAIESLKAEAE